MEDNMLSRKEPSPHTLVWKTLHWKALKHVSSTPGSMQKARPEAPTNPEPYCNSSRLLYTSVFYCIHSMLQ